MKYDVCVFTSTHPATDTRVYGKEVKSLLKGGFSILYYTNQSGLKNNNSNAGDISYHPRLKVIKNSGFNVEKRLGRFLRSFLMYFRISKKCSVYHFHDPDLIFCGAILKMTGKTVIYDVHENYVDSISEKPYLSGFMQKLLSFLYRSAENLFCRQYDMIIAATPSIKSFYDTRGFQNVRIIYNYPYQQELISKHPSERSKRRNTFIYVGGITRIRGITNLVNALELANARESIDLVLGGPIFPGSYQKELERLSGWKYVEYLGPLSRSRMAQEFNEAMCGICLFLPLKNHVEAMPNKIFEYMSAGLPVLCSNFDLWEKLVVQNKVGYVCDPEDINSIAETLVNIARLDQEELDLKGRTGIELIQTKYCWENEEKKLLELYQKLG
jgi:glycosyltransferase involved in cell wall biosynthesis